MIECSLTCCQVRVAVLSLNRRGRETKRVLGGGGGFGRQSAIVSSGLGSS